ncbi:MAG: hypothetical protein JXA50_11370 [Deltaproteobacteria bacterium]|nr:hypothetical protein [Deltaproteobacteria bacterium]
MENEKKVKTTPYIIGMFGNLIGFVIGSMFLTQIIAPMFQPMTEYKGALLWAILGLALAAIGNSACVIISAPRNILNTIIGASIGLTIGIAISLFPYAYLIGIVTIFIGTTSGHYYKT